MSGPDNEIPPPAMIEQFDISNSRLLSHSSRLSTMVARQSLVNCDSKGKPGRDNAFSVLMSSVKENEAWKEASIDKTFGPPQAGSSRRKAPFYKVLQGMPIAVDAFNFGEIPGVTAYFLTSVHHSFLLSAC